MRLPKIDVDEVATKAVWTIVVGVISLGLYVGGISAIDSREAQRIEIASLRSDVNTLLVYHDHVVKEEKKDDIKWSTKTWNWISFKEFRK